MSQVFPAQSAGWELETKVSNRTFVIELFVMLVVVPDVTVVLEGTLPQRQQVVQFAHAAQVMIAQSGYFANIRVVVTSTTTTTTDNISMTKDRKTAFDMSCVG